MEPYEERLIELKAVEALIRALKSMSETEEERLAHSAALKKLKRVQRKVGISGSLFGFLSNFKISKLGRNALLLIKRVRMAVNVYKFYRHYSMPRKASAVLKTLLAL